MTKKIIIGAVVVLIFLAVIGSANNTNTATETSQPPAAITGSSISPKTDKTPPQQATPAYLIKHRDENNRVENYEILIKPGADGENAALDLKKQCKKPCNIFVYDDAKAQQLDREYDEISDGYSATAWKQQNYVYVADHLVGNIDFETGEWSVYPYRDYYYRQQGGQH